MRFLNLICRCLGGSTERESLLRSNDSPTSSCSDDVAPECASTDKYTSAGKPCEICNESRVPREECCLRAVPLMLC
jgi:hypothetical protein